MKIQINNKRYLEIEIKCNRIVITKYNDKNEVECRRAIDEIEFIDLYNILVYAHDNGKKIYELWEVKHDR